jgi:hypothetical protein
MASPIVSGFGGRLGYAAISIVAVVAARRQPTINMETEALAVDRPIDDRA